MDRRELIEQAASASPMIEVAKMFCRYVLVGLQENPTFDRLPEFELIPHWSMEVFQCQAIVKIEGEVWVRLVCGTYERRLPPSEFGIIVAARAESLVAEFFYWLNKERVGA